MHLFQSLAKEQEEYPLLNKPSIQPPYANQHTHCDIMTRILFIYAKLNPGVKYIQGMNEVLAPIYFTFA